MSLQASSRRALLLAVVFAGLASGCGNWHRAVLMAGEPVVNRDTTWMAVGIEFSHYRHLTNLEVLALVLTHGTNGEHGYEIQTYDLAHRKGPRRIARWGRGERESPWIVGWDDSGIVVARGPRDAMLLVRVDPISGVVRPSGLPPGLSLGTWRDSLNYLGSAWDREHRRHIETRIGGFFLWNPRSREEEFLFALPSGHEGYPDPFAAQQAEEAAEDRYDRSFHRIWEVSTRPEADSARIFIETYVPRPGSETRRYVLSLNIEVPDPSHDTPVRSAHRRIPLTERELRLGPRAAKLQLAIPNRRLRAMIKPYIRSMRRPEWSPVVGIVIGVALRAVPDRGDTTLIASGIRDGSVGSVDTSVQIRIH